MENELPSDLSIWNERCMKIFIETNSALFRVFASRYVKDIDIIDDFLQEAYIKLWTHRKSIGEVKSLRNYFYTLLYHTILDKQASTPTHKVSIESPEIQEIPSDSSLFHHIVEMESAQLITEALKKLSKQSNQVLLMSMEGKSIPEIAQELDLSINTVKTVKYRALKRLSSLLSKEDFLLLLLLLAY